MNFVPQIVRYTLNLPQSGALKGEALTAEQWGGVIEFCVGFIGLKLLRSNDLFYVTSNIGREFSG